MLLEGRARQCRGACFECLDAGAAVGPRRSGRLQMSSLSKLELCGRMGVGVFSASSEGVDAFERVVFEL
eukprot:1651197-Alexandrium_andersonii.AAC.1